MKKITLMIVFLAISWMRPAVAEEKPKELKDRISSVSNRVFVKSRRLELMIFPLTSISLNDAFYEKLGFGAGLAYHISEAFAIQAIGTYTFDKLNIKTSNTSLFTTDNKGTMHLPYSGKRTWLADIDLTWAPIYGKINVASEAVMHFDTYLLAGFGAIGGELADKKTNVGLAATFGLGIRLFFTRNLALKAELKDFMIFNDEVTIREGQPSSSHFQHQLMFNLGLSFFFLEGIVEE